MTEWYMLEKGIMEDERRYDQITREGEADEEAAVLIELMWSH